MVSGQQGLSQIGQIALPVRDIERATAFYRDTLGMRFLFSAGPLAFFDCAGIRLMLSAPESDEQARGSIIYFQADDIQALYELLRSRGVAFIDEPHVIAKLETVTVWMAFFRDSEGNMLGIMSEVPHEG